MILKNIKLKERLKAIKKNSSEIEDIIVFGSLVRGKLDYKDIDIMVIFKERVDKQIEYNIKKEIGKYYDNISIISKTRENALDMAFDARESILFEGKSLLGGKILSEKYGFSSLGMFKYDIKSWDNLKKTKFYHALNGRLDKSGILKSLSCIKFSDNIILAPLDKIEPMREFLDSWKIDYKYFPILMPQRLKAII